MHNTAYTQENGSSPNSSLEFARYFRHLSLAFILVAAVVIAVIHYAVNRDFITTVSESNNVSMAQMMINHLEYGLDHPGSPDQKPAPDRSYLKFLNQAKSLSAQQLRDHPQTHMLSETIRSMVKGLKMIKVKIYATNGKILFSTEHDEIGGMEEPGQNFIRALQGEVSSTLGHQTFGRTTDHAAPAVDYVETYVPLQFDGVVELVFELYYDVADEIHGVVNSTLITGAGVLFVLLVVYVALIRIVQPANRALRKQYLNNQRLSRAVEQSASMVVITDLDGTINYVNPKFLELTGYAASEVLGNNPRLIKSGNTPPKIYQEMWQTIVSGETWQGEIQNRKKSGELYWEYQTISPVASE